MEYTDETYYGKYLDGLKRTQADMLSVIHRLLEEITDDPENAPAEHILSRIKGPESAMEKLHRLGHPTDAKSALLFLSDLIGVRIVTHFTGDVYAILNKLQNDSGWEIVTVKDYISNPKPNGYRSLHVILKIPFADGELSCILTEIQLRTIAMDCWASLEHQMKYKKTLPM